MAADQSTLGDDAPASASDELPRVDPAHYEVGSEISRGGIGKVIRGHDKRLDRTVAIKQLLAMSSASVGRFQREVRITARLQHPGIVPIYEAGRWPNGEPFYAMRMISGRTFKEEIGQATTLDERLALIPKLLAVCEAIAYAHEQAVIHRDLKPTNVMVGEFGEVIVVDWGLALELEREDDLPAAVVGTPPFMSPEQAAGAPVDRRTDVFALGTMLQQLLGDAAGAPRDLCAIVTKATADRELRYRDAGELAHDLRRFQEGQLVGAHEYSWPTLLRRWIARHRAIVAIAAVAIATIAVIAKISISRVLEERDVATAARTAEADARVHAEAETLANQKRNSELTLLQAEHWLDRDPTVALDWLARHVDSIAPDPRKSRELAVAAIGRGVATRVDHGELVIGAARDGTLVGLADSLPAIWIQDQRRVLSKLPVATTIAISDDGAHAAWIDAGGLEVFDRARGEVRTLSPRTDEKPPYDLIVASGLVATAEIGGPIRLTPIAGGPATTLTGHTATVEDITVAPDGAHLATTAAGAVRLWTVATGKSTELPGDGRVFVMRFDARGQHFAWAGQRGTIRWIDVAKPLEVHAIKPAVAGGIAALAFDGQGTRLASGGEAGIVRIDRLGGEPLLAAKGHTDFINGIAFSPDGSTVVSAQSRGGAVIAWDVATGDRRRLHGHDATLTLLKFLADGTLVTADRRSEVRHWRLSHAIERVIYRGGEATAQIAALHDDAFLGIAGKQPAVWDALDRPPRVLAMPAGLNTSLVVSPDHTLAAAGDEDGNVWIWTLATGAAKLVENGKAREVAFSPDGKRLAVGGVDGTVRIWRVDDLAAAPTRLTGAIGEILGLAFAPDGKHLVTASEDANVAWWDLATGTSTKILAHGAVQAMTFHDDGTLAVGRSSGLIEVRSPEGQVRELRATGQIAQLLFVSKTTLASAANDGTVRLWNLETGSAVVLPHAGRVGALLHVGELLISANSVDDNGDATIRVWDLATASLRVEWHGHLGTIASVTATKTAVLSLGDDGTIRRWPIDPPPPLVTPTRAWLRDQTATLSDTP